MNERADRDGDVLLEPGPLPDRDGDRDRDEHERRRELAEADVDRRDHRASSSLAAPCPTALPPSSSLSTQSAIRAAWSRSWVTST